MNEEELQKYIKAGKIASKALHYGKGLIKEGASLLYVSEKVEEKIAELGGKPAFPAQISLNNIAAHSCAEPDDLTIFKDGDLAKLDVGVHVDGYVADTALSIDIGGHHKELILASQNALNAAIKLATPGTKLSDIGKAIQDEITVLGFSPIKNLSGHGVGKYIIHGPPQIPNYETGTNATLVEDQVIAIEPFASKGKGMIYETENANIFMVTSKKPVRSPITREILREINEYNGLPFTTRWLTRKFPLFKVRVAIRELLTHNIIKAFPPLPDKDYVSQAEHTIIVKDKPIVTTKHNLADDIGNLMHK